MATAKKAAKQQEDKGAAVLTCGQQRFSIGQTVDHYGGDFEGTEKAE